MRELQSQCFEGTGHTFWHSSTIQSHRSSPQEEKCFRANPTTPRMDWCVLCFVPRYCEYEIAEGLY
jgi:hypothetical protein